MSEPSIGEKLDRLAESFLDHLRRGGHPSFTEYAVKHPDLADEIRELFPALIEMEALKRASGGLDSASLARGSGASDAGIPDRLGDYRIVRLIGRGGMGVVYEAERESLTARVALKVLHPKLRDDEQYRRRFRNEARSAARLHHTNIVTVFDFGDQDGTLFYAMQFIPGQGLDHILRDVRRLRQAAPRAPAPEDPTAPPTLAEAIQTGRYSRLSDSGASTGPSFVLKGRPKPTAYREEAGDDATPHPGAGEDAPGEGDVTPDPQPSSATSLTGSGPGRYGREVARIGAEAAEALAYAHRRGVQHRDIKPSNILLDARGTAWITDFGLAKIEGDDGLTETGDVVGTLRYIAPERFEGHSDARCDIYALGVTLYEMLALRPAFEGGNRARVIRQILQGAPVPLRRIDPRISRDLETVVHKAMARLPADRYGSATELAAELRRVVANQPILARRSPLLEQYWRWCKRNRLAAALTALATVLTIAVAVVSTAAYFRQSQLNGEIREHLQRVEQAEEEKSAQLFEANLLEARAWRHSRQSGQRFEALAAVERASRIGRDLGYPPSRFDALRTEAIAALALPDLHVTRTFADRNIEEVVDISDDFEWFCVSDSEGRCTVRRVADEKVVVRLPDLPGPRQATFGSRRWLTDRDGTGAFRVWDLSGDRPVERLRLPEGVISWDFRPDGTRLVVAHLDGSLNVYELPGGRRLKSWELGAFRTEPRLRIHPTEPYVVVTDHFVRHFELRHLETGQALEIRPPWDDAGCYDCDWSADGHLLAVPKSGDSIALYGFRPEGPTLRPLKTLDNGVGSGLMLRFNPKSDRLLARGWSNSVGLFDLDSRRISAETRAFNVSGPVPLRVDPTGTRVFPARIDEPSVRVGYWSIADGRECALLAPDSSDMPSSRIAVSPDGRLVAVSSVGGRLTVFDVETGRDIGHTQLPGAGDLQLAFDRYGRLYTCSDVDVQRWPIVSAPSEPGSIRIGPPESLSLPPGFNEFVVGRDGRVLAHAIGKNGDVSTRGGWVLRLDDPGRPRRVCLHPNIASAAVSPDGRWTAFGVNGGVGIYVYENSTGALAATWPARNTRSRFSPCGRWLSGAGEETDLYRVGTWARGPSLGPGSLSDFSADGSTALLSPRSGLIRVVQVPTGRELARLEDPEPSAVHCEVAALVSGDTRIAVRHDRGLRVWDLRLLRDGLEKLDLDWHAPSYPPRTAAPGPLAVRFVGVDRLAPKVRAYRELLEAIVAPYFVGQLVQARDYLRRGRALGGLGFFGLAARDYETALKLDTNLAEARVALGLVRFRTGDWRAAVAELTRALEGRPPSTDLLFRRAWAFHELGRDDDAIADFDSAIAINDGETPRQRSLLVLRSVCQAARGRPELAAADLRRADEGRGDLARPVNQDAWLLLMAPPERRADAAALVLAKEATSRRRLDRVIQNTLALALYRNDRYAEAVEILNRNLAMGPRAAEAGDLYILAMCHRRLGQTIEAVRTFERATSSWRQKPGLSEREKNEMLQLENEARRTLGLVR